MNTKQLIQITILLFFAAAAKAQNTKAQARFYVTDTADKSKYIGPITEIDGEELRKQGDLIVRIPIPKNVQCDKIYFSIQIQLIDTDGNLFYGQDKFSNTYNTPIPLFKNEVKGKKEIEFHVLADSGTRSDFKFQDVVEADTSIICPITHFDMMYQVQSKVKEIHLIAGVIGQVKTGTEEDTDEQGKPVTIPVYGNDFFLFSDEAHPFIIKNK